MALMNRDADDHGWGHFGWDCFGCCLLEVVFWLLLFLTWRGCHGE